MMPPHLWYLAPELWVAGLAALILLVDLACKGKGSREIPLGAAIALLPVAPILLLQVNLGTRTLLGGMYRLDPLALFFKVIFVAAGILVLVMTREFSRTLERAHAEFTALILLALLGMLLAASSASFLMLFVALELITISFYVMTAYLKTDARSLEAGLKYLILGSIASGLFLYGIAWVYGAAGTTSFAGLRQALAGRTTLSPGLALGLLLIVSGITFKAACVPLHLWVPDVYEGAPTPVTAFLSVGSKSAGFVAALRVLHELFLPASNQWAGLIAWLAGLTILYGNLCAIPQKNIKRLMGYSSIGHAGYILIGVAAASSLGSAATSFYLAGYLVSNLTIFLVISAFWQAVGSDEMADYAGLSRRSPFLAAAMFVALLSLAGVPPMVGFFGKFLLLLSAIQEGFLWVAIVGAAAVVISLYYYLLLVATMYADPPKDPTPIPVSLPVRLALYACLAGILGIGIFQEPCVRLSLAAVRSFF